MKINSELVKALREERSWSQDELAIAAGVNLRTIQRIEKEASASLQSKKAIASALDIDVRDLDYQEVPMKLAYKYKTIEIDPKEGFLTGVKRSKLPDFTGILNDHGKDGWKLIQLVTPDLAQGIWAGKTGRYVALLERQIVE